MTRSRQSLLRLESEDLLRPSAGKHQNSRGAHLLDHGAGEWPATAEPIRGVVADPVLIEEDEVLGHNHPLRLDLRICLFEVSDDPRIEDAKFIAFGVKQDDPRNIALTNIGSNCPEVQESLDLCCLIIRPEVQVQPILGHPRVGYGNEEQSGCDICCRPDLEFPVRILGHEPIEGSCPPESERPRTVGIDDDLFPRQDHGAMIADRTWIDTTPQSSDSSGVHDAFVANVLV